MIPPADPSQPSHGWLSFYLNEKGINVGILPREEKRASLKGTFIFPPAIQISLHMVGYRLLSKNRNQTGELSWQGKGFLSA